MDLRIDQDHLPSRAEKADSGPYDPPVVRIHVLKAEHSGRRKLIHGREDADTNLYFITDGEYIKIGVATDVESRCSYLQCGNARPLRIISTRPVPHKDEGRVHRALKSERIRGEWFNPTPQVLATARDCPERGADIYPRRRSLDETFARIAHEHAVDERQLREDFVQAAHAFAERLAA